MENAAREDRPTRSPFGNGGVAHPRRHVRARAACIGATALLVSAWLASGDNAIANGADPAPQTLRSGASNVCGDWAMIAAEEAGIPVDLMRAIAAVESGRRYAAKPDRSHPAWPWTVGTGSGGRWFATAREALVFARARVAAGDTVDIGCFQLNYRWHGRAFESLEAMFAPDRNARYAARFLAALHAEFGDWTRAAAAYHSRTPEHGRAYLLRLSAALGTLRDPDGSALGQVSRPRRVPAAVAALHPAVPLAEASGARTGSLSRAAPGSLVVPGAQGRPLINPSGRAEQ